MRALWTRLIALAAAAGLLLAFAPPAQADDGIPVQVRVVDPEGNPVSTAVVRHPKEAERHRVNTVTGVWEGSTLYLPDGSMIRFDRGMELSFEISAPGYVTETVHYIVRRRRNRIDVTLEPMEVEEPDELEMPGIGFGRERPIGGQPIEPEGDED